MNNSIGACRGRHIAAILALAASLLAPGVCAGARADALDNYIENQLHRQRIAGISLAVIKDGKIVKAKGYGAANIETGTPASADTVYKIGSISKCFFGVAIMMLAEDSRLRLDDTVARYFPDAPEAWKSITIRQLLTHTSGIVEDPPGFTPFESQSDERIVKSLYTAPLLFKPGEQWSYSNANYFVLGEIIRRVSGKPWSGFIEERIFHPLHMDSTRVTTTTEIVPHRAEGYIWNGGRFTKAEDWVAVRPSGAFLSTVMDMAKWDAAVRRRALLKPASWEQILTPVQLRTGKSYPYGFGFFLDPWQGHRQIHHEGQLPGFIGAYQDFPDDHLTLVMLTNTDEIDPLPLAHSIAGFYVRALAPPVYNPIPDANPAITAKAWRFIESFIAGHPDRALFPDDIATNISADTGLRARVGNRLKKWGNPRALALVERVPKGGETYYRYRIAYRDAGSLLLGLTFDAQGLIRGWGYDTDAADSTLSTR